MTDYMTLTCPSCGGSLQITNDVDRFACGHCGKEHIVRRGGGIVTLAPVVEGIKRVQAGVDKTASELAISRLEKEIKQLKNKIADEKSKFDSANFFKSSGGLAVLIFMIIGGSTGDAGAGFWVAVIDSTEKSLQAETSPVDMGGAVKPHPPYLPAVSVYGVFFQ